MPPALKAWSTRAFTLPEMMIAMATFGMVIGGFLSAHLFGLKYDQRVCSKLGASDQSRMTFGLLTSDIRASKIWRIGRGNSSGFTNLPNATLQQGNALQLFLTTNTNSWIRYYFETNGPTTADPNGRLWRITSDGDADIIAQSLSNATTNSMTFYAEDYRGTIVSDYNYKYVIVTLMEFCQFQYPKTYVGPGYLYDYYRILLKSASHCPS
jgi:prepilin-type N-terminal cleavage/methylation domain-containing protein